MNCPKCGSPVGKNDEYCGSCGYHLNTSGEEKPKKKKSGLMIFTIFLEVIAIVVIVGAIFFGVRSNKETKKDDGTQTEESSDSSEDKKESGNALKSEGQEEAGDSSNEENHEDSENHAEPAPDDSSAQDTGAGMKKITSAELLEDSDLLKSIKKTYTRIGSGAITKADASSVIDQDLVGNEPIKAFDDNDSTDWQEGVDGPGIGEYLEFAFDKSYPVAYMTFKLGNWLPDKSDKYYWGNCRPKTLQIDSGNNSWNFTFPDGKEEFLVRLDPETDISNIKITIQDVYTDRIEWKDTAITDIGLWYKED